MTRLPATPSARRRVIIGAAGIALVLALLYLMRVVMLGIGASEGDVPPVAALGLPEGSEVVDEQRVCASRGCWLELQVAPPADMSPHLLAVAIGATPGAGHPGTWWDPRSISFYAEPTSNVLNVELS